MLWKISFFNLKPDIDEDLFKQYETEMLPHYQAYLQSLGQQYVGCYRVMLETLPGSTLNGFHFQATYAEVCLVDAAGIEAAVTNEVDIPCPAVVQAMLAKRTAFFVPDQRVRLWLQPMALSALVSRPLPILDRLLRIILRTFPAERSMADYIAFDQRIMGRYTEYMMQAKWYQVGVYHVFGLPDYMYVDAFDVIDAKSVEEAIANDAAVLITPEMQAIYDECSLYLDRTRERFLIWFTPFIPGLEALPALDVLLDVAH